MTYEDLLIVPYKANGRDERGMDCYGLVIELCKRNGVYLKDLAYVKDIPAEQLYDFVTQFGAIEVDIPRAGLIAQWNYGGHLHVGYMVSKKVCIHMTFTGVQVVPIDAIKCVKYFEV
jgi:cell wall-associated NlpC family hydrolase